MLGARARRTAYSLNDGFPVQIPNGQTSRKLHRLLFKMTIMTRMWKHKPETRMPTAVEIQRKNLRRWAHLELPNVITTNTTILPGP